MTSLNDITDLYRLDADVVSELLKDDNEVSEDLYEQLQKIKSELISREMENLNDEDVLSDIQLVEELMPDNLTPIEKVRWIYINLGKLFSYDYRVVNDPSLGYGKKINTKEFIGRYQTCVQISQILAEVLNRIDGIECNVIKRRLDGARGLFGEDHVANEVLLTQDGYTYKLMLDLTLDLYLIQSNCFTKHFCYQDDGTGTYDIIPIRDDIEMDKKLGFVDSDNDYTDRLIEIVKDELNAYDYSNHTSKEIVEYKIDYILNRFKRVFSGYHEGKQYINLLFNELLRIQYREFNLYHQKDNKVNLKTIYRIDSGDYVKWIVYSNKSGFICVDEERLKHMLANGWQTNSTTLMNILYPSEKKRDM